MKRRRGWIASLSAEEVFWRGLFGSLAGGVGRAFRQTRSLSRLGRIQSGESNMSRLRVNAFSVSLDGYAAGPGQSLENPLGVGGKALHEWVFPTRTFRQTHGADGGEAGVDDDFAAASFANVGAWILGRNMFGPVRGPWPDESWKGWWGANPPYHVPVFVLTHHPRESIEMEGGTTFHFVTDGIEAALDRARAAAGGRDVRLGGGVSTVRQYLQAGLVDELHLAIAPVALGAGESLLGGIDLPKLGFAVTRHASTEHALHVVLSRTTAG
jgi:dihydrofolate reductase